MNSALNKWLIASVICAAVFGGLAYKFRNSPHDNLCREDKTLDFCAYIDIELRSLDVSLVPYDGEKIRAVYTNDRPLEFETGYNSLKITESMKFIISLFAQTADDLSLTLYIPRREMRNISINTGKGNVDIEDIYARGEFTIITESGDVRVKGASSVMSVTTTDGFISLDFKDEIPDGCEIYSRKGGAEIFIPENASFAVDFVTETGVCTDTLTGNTFDKSDIFGINGGAVCLNAQINSGELKIKAKGQ